MTKSIRTLILQVFSVCVLTCIAGPGRARGDLQLTLDSSTPTTVLPGATVDIVIDIKNTSSTEILIYLGTVIDTNETLPSHTVIPPSSSSDTTPGTAIEPGATVKFSATYDLSSSPLTDTSFSTKFTSEALFESNGTTGTRSISPSITITTESIPTPEPNTLILSVLGGACGIGYVMARKRRQTRDRAARS
jgi:hypothetical protein